VVALVLLGAGASFGSGDTHPHPPPLGTQLFNKLEELGGYAASLPNELKAVFRRDFEAGMAEFEKYGFKVDLHEFHRELAHYIVSFTPGLNNVYVDLIRALGNKRVVYCSLNYDLMFEISGARLGLQPAYHDEFPQDVPGRPPNTFVRILKPHGSSNFWPDMQGEILKNNRFFGFAADVTADVEILNQVETLQRCKVDKGFSPAISMFAVGKAVRACPAYVARQQEKWRRVAEKASRIFVVGVRVHQVDEHIWGVLGKTKAPVTYFGVSDNDEVEFNDWQNQSGKRNAWFVRADFAQSVKHMRALLKGR
jgi:hypothetical protein